MLWGAAQFSKCSFSSKQVKFRREYPARYFQGIFRGIGGKLPLKTYWGSVPRCLTLSDCPQKSIPLPCTCRTCTNRRLSERHIGKLLTLPQRFRKLYHGVFIFVKQKRETCVSLYSASSISEQSFSTRWGFSSDASRISWVVSPLMTSMVVIPAFSPDLMSV